MKDSHAEVSSAPRTGICYLVGAGDPPRAFHLAPDDLLIAADGGYDILTARGIRPHLLVGDLDSITTRATDVPLLRFPVRKDEADMMLAWREGHRRGYRRFCLLGGTGGREDHTFANYALLLAIRRAGDRALLVGTADTVLMIENETVTIPLKNRTGRHFSAFPFDGAARDVTITGLSYTAEHITLSPDYPLAVSNLFDTTDATVSVGDGALLLFLEDLPADEPDLSLLAF